MHLRHPSRILSDNSPELNFRTLIARNLGGLTMPAPLNAKSAEQNLRTVLNTARGEGEGTVFVGENSVSRRGAWSRLFGLNPTTHQASIANFKALLQRTYPNSTGKIDAVLAASVTRGRLTSGAVIRAYMQLHDEHKFRIEYPGTATTDSAKLEFEDHRALAVLQNDKTRTVVCDFANRLADHIEQSQTFTDGKARTFLKAHLQRQSNYPVHIGAENIPKTKAGIVEFLRTTAASADDDRHVLLLSMMWTLPNGVGQVEKLPEADLISRLYKSKVVEGKQHVDKRAVFIKLTKELDSTAQKLAGNLTAEPLTDEQVSVLLKLSRPDPSHLKQPGELPRPSTNSELINFLRAPASADDTDAMLLKSFISLKLLKDGHTKTRIQSLQSRLIANQTDQGFDRIMGAVTRPDTFGNTEIASTLMNRIAPHQKEREAVSVNRSRNARVQKFLAEGNPYISGFSGMTNSGTTLFPLLGINMNSEDGRQYAEALGAFIVGSGEHSYPEVYKSLNLSLRYVQLAQPESPDPANRAAVPDPAILTDAALFGLIAEPRAPTKA